MILVSDVQHKIWWKLVWLYIKFECSKSSFFNSMITFSSFFLTYNFYTRKIDLRRTCLFWGFSSNLKDKRVLKFNLYLPTIEFCCWTDYFNQTFIISMFMTIIHKFTFVKTVFLFRYIEILMSLYYYILCILNDKLTW